MTTLLTLFLEAYFLVAGINPTAKNTVKHRKGVFYEGKSKFSGLLVNKDSKGVIREKLSIWNGVKIGKHQKFFKNGQLISEGYYLSNKRYHQHKGWHSNGKIRYLTNYLNGKREGEQWVWFPSGQLNSYILIQGGKEIGYKKWQPNGMIQTNYVFRENERIGVDGLRNCATASKGAIADSQAVKP